MITKEIRVELGERSYSVYFGNGLLASLGPVFQEHRLSTEITVVTDRNVGRHYLGPLRRQLKKNGFAVEAIEIPPGETQKSLASANRIYTKMLRARTGRSATVVALGGGVIGDLAGFVASTYHRGVKLVQIPTTLLAQVDSAIGGKTAVNHALGKNMIGSFHQPNVVIADMDTLRTLPIRELYCGLGEVVKYGIILDEAMFSYLEDHLDDVVRLKDDVLVHVASRCAELKAGLVSRDERESGDRIILNCGHTIGHALEAAGKFRMLKHGEAVLMGLAAESFIAKSMGLMAPQSYERIAGLIRRIPLTVRKSALTISNILSLIPRDKKSVHGINRFVLPTGVGGTKVVENVPLPLIQEAIQSLRNVGFGAGRL